MHRSERHSMLRVEPLHQRIPSAHDSNSNTDSDSESLARISFLERENSELKQEVSRLRAQLNTLKAHDTERKTMLWKKIQNSMDNNIPHHTSQPKPTFIMPDKLPIHRQMEELKPVPRFTAALPDKLQSSPPPPPPPLPSKLLGGTKAVRRVPEVMEFYRALMKRDSLSKNTTTVAGNQVTPINPKNMIGEIENRSTHLLAIKTDVETHGEFISQLSEQVESAAFTEISQVETFVKWMDEEMSCLVDERAVLKHFPQWPERKADALREAACTYRDLNNLMSEVVSFKDNPRQLFTQSLRKMQAVQDRVEQAVDNAERMREGTAKRYRELHIPWAWMLDTGLIGQLKLSSLTLAEQYMRRVAKELTESSDPAQDENYLIQAVRFACRVHQFAGGFDAEAIEDFQLLKKLATSSTAVSKAR